MRCMISLAVFGAFGLAQAALAQAAGPVTSLNGGGEWEIWAPRPEIAPKSSRNDHTGRTGA